MTWELKETKFPSPLLAVPACSVSKRIWSSETQFSVLPWWDGRPSPSQRGEDCLWRHFELSSNHRSQALWPMPTRSPFSLRSTKSALHHCHHTHRSTHLRLCGSTTRGRTTALVKLLALGLSKIGAPSAQLMRHVGNPESCPRHLFYLTPIPARVHAYFPQIHSQPLATGLLLGPISFQSS